MAIGEGPSDSTAQPTQEEDKSAKEMPGHSCSSTLLEGL